VRDASAAVEAGIREGLTAGSEESLGSHRIAVCGHNPFSIRNPQTAIRN
jgi:hypothetical protein